MSSDEGYGIDVGEYTDLPQSERLHSGKHAHVDWFQGCNLEKDTEFARSNSCMLLIHDEKLSVLEASIYAKACKSI